MESVIFSPSEKNLLKAAELFQDGFLDNSILVLLNNNFLVSLIMSRKYFVL